MPPRLQRLPCLTLPGGLRLARAGTPLARLRGLAGLAEIPDDVGLLLVGCASVHTLGMRFALDLVWLGADGRVLRVDAGVRPRRLAGRRSAAAVVEAPAGAGERFAAALDEAPLPVLGAGVPTA